MSVEIDDTRFRAAHEAFCRHMLQQSDGVEFVNFQHPFLVEDEIDYKRIVYGKAKDALSLEEWPQWVEHAPTKIIGATKNACASKVSANLVVVSSYGPQNSSEAPLFRVKGKTQVAGLARQLFDFFKGDPSTIDDFGPRFDALANYLREHHLSCKWRFLTYLAFLLNPDLYFPVVPTPFDRLLEFYGVKEGISGYVSWERYSVLLALAEALKSKLAVYGQVNTLEIQSYMWVVSYLLKDGKVHKRPVAEVPDLDTALATRVQRAQQRESTGIQGELLVYERERAKLKKAGLPDLADRVHLAAWSDDNVGFDVLSFNADRTELHIEVKTTASSPDQDPGFWLSENERLLAEQDPAWCIYRVWNIGSSPKVENLGNMVKQPSMQWELCVSTWSVRRKADVG